MRVLCDEHKKCFWPLLYIYCKIKRKIANDSKQIFKLLMNISSFIVKFLEKLSLTKRFLLHSIKQKDFFFSESMKRFLLFFCIIPSPLFFIDVSYQR